MKACILARVERTGVIFEDKKFIETCWTHNLAVLLKAADLETARGAEAGANPKFDAYWRAVIKWQEDVRYEFTSQLEAEALHTAIADPADGVLRWIRLHW